MLFPDSELIFQLYNTCVHTVLAPKLLLEQCGVGVEPGKPVFHSAAQSTDRSEKSKGYRAFSASPRGLVRLIFLLYHGQLASCWHQNSRRTMRDRSLNLVNRYSIRRCNRQISLLKSYFKAKGVSGNGRRVAFINRRFSIIAFTL